jgi:aerobic carbon-monoxide dehydrogenase large subunit
MNTPISADKLALMKFGIGQPVPRKEDPALLRGEGRYTDDINLPSQVCAVMVRSPYAHGVIRGIATEAARDMPGVLGVYTAADLAAGGYGPLKIVPAFKNRDGSPMRKPARFALAADRVRFVGDPVAFVVGETAAQARDAAETVDLDIEALPAVTRADEALRPGAPQLYDDVPGNRPLDFHFGDATRAAEAFAKAAHVTRLKLADNRVVVNPMEPRSAIAAYDPADGRWTLHLGSQGVFGLRQNMAEILGVRPEKMRIVTGNVGGSFGMKAAPYPEYICLLHAARALGRPVKWTDQRAESFLSDHHGRAIEVEAELALDSDGRFLAARINGVADMGAFLVQMSPLPSTLNVAKNLISVYRTPVIDVSIRCAFTNTTPIGPYRGAGRPEGNYFMERLVDTAAAEMGIDPVEMRRRNHIRPEELPYAAPSEMTYDSGDFTRLLERAIEAADWTGYAARRAESRARGKLRGRGIGQYLEVTAPPQNEMGGIRFEADGTVTILTGTLDYGQGHAAPFAQVLTNKLGIPFDKIRLIQGDSDELIAGGGTGGSKSIMASGTAIAEASEKVVGQGRQIAAHVLEAGVADIEFTNGRFTIAGTDRSIGLMDLAEQLRNGLDLPPDLPRSLDVKHVHRHSPSAFPNGCHIAEVEVDPETGEVEVVKYSSVNDFGTLINPLLVEGQLHGGIVQGIGQALMEMTAYDEGGQLVTGSYMDYALPRADNAPFFAFESYPVPATTNPLGVKGCGEAGCAGSLTSVMNALVDALREKGVDHIDMPATPCRVWEALRSARS